MKYTHLPEKFEAKKQIAHYLDENGIEFALPVKAKDGEPIFTDEIKQELDRRSGANNSVTPKTLSFIKTDEGDFVRLSWEATKAGDAVNTSIPFTIPHTSRILSGKVLFEVEGEEAYEKVAADGDWSISINKAYTATALEPSEMECDYLKATGADKEIAIIPFNHRIEWS